MLIIPECSKALSLILLVVLTLSSCSEQQTTYTEHNVIQQAKGPYLGQTPPGEKAELFAPGLISTNLHDDGGPAFSPDGNEVFWRISEKPVAIIGYMKQVNGIWTEPELASFSGRWGTGPVKFSADGKSIYFSSSRPELPEETESNHNIWYVEKSDSGWGEPKIMTSPVNSKSEEIFGGISADGSIYFTAAKQFGNNPDNYKVYRCLKVAGEYQEPEMLPETINSPGVLTILVALAADESYVILSIQGREDSFGGQDLYVSFRDESDNWSYPVNLGPGVNSSSSDWLASLSPDGKYLFFTSFRFQTEDLSNITRSWDEWIKRYNSANNGSGGDIFWVSTSVIEKLRPSE